MSTVPPHTIRSMGTSIFRTAWLFQAVATFPLAFYLGANVFNSIYQSYQYLDVYRFTTYMFNTLFASAIIFIVSIQYKMTERDRKISHHLNLRFEVSKASIATVMWIWLLLDSIFYIPRYYSGPRSKHIAISAISFILVIVLFYPVAFYVAYARKEAATSQEAAGRDEENAGVGGETTPLLAERT